MTEDVVWLLFALVLFGWYAYALLKIRNGWLGCASEPRATRAALREFLAGAAVGNLMSPLAGLVVLGILGRIGFFAMAGAAGTFGLSLIVHACWRARRDLRFSAFQGRWTKSRTGNLS